MAGMNAATTPPVVCDETAKKTTNPILWLQIPEWCVCASVLLRYTSPNYSCSTLIFGVEQ